MTQDTKAPEQCYCTDCEEYTHVGYGGRGACGHGRIITLRSALAALEEAAARADRAAQEARELALQEAIVAARHAPDAELAHDAILALMDTTHGEAMERVRAEVEARGMERAAKRAHDLSDAMLGEGLSDEAEGAYRAAVVIRTAIRARTEGEG